MEASRMSLNNSTCWYSHYPGPKML